MKLNEPSMGKQRLMQKRAVLKELYTPTSQKVFFRSEVYLLQIFHGSTKLQSWSLDWLQNIPPGPQSSIIPNTTASSFLYRSSFFLSAHSMWPLLDIMISLLFLLKKCCLTNYNTSHATFSPKGKSSQHLSCHDFSVCRVVSAYRLFFLMVKFFWSCLHSPEWGPAQCKMSYSHCADQRAL